MMLNNKYSIIIGALSLLLLSGCATKQDTCKLDPQTGSMRCLGDEKQYFSASNAKSDYEKERDKMLSKIVKTPPIPMRIQDTILRVLILPYVDDAGVLTAQSYKFTKVDDGKWIMGEYLLNGNDEIGVLTPLSSKIISSSNDNAKQEVSLNQQGEEKVPKNPVTDTQTFQDSGKIEKIQQGLQQ